MTVIEQASSFLQALFTPSDLILFRPIETWTELGRKKSRVDYDGIRYERFGLRAADGSWVWWPGKVESTLSEILARAEAESTNIFFGTCPRYGADGRYDLAWQIRTVRTLWCDVDNATPGEVQARIQSAGLPAPSVLVHSGNGCHVYWLLDQPAEIADADTPQPVHTEWQERTDHTSGATKKKRKLYLTDPTTGEHLSLDARQNIPELSPQAQAIQDILAGIAAKIGGDHTQDLSRILRIPGTWNRKDQRNGRAPVSCSLIHCDPGRRYPLEQFAGLAATSPAKARRDKVHQVPLPAKRKLTAKREDRFHTLLADCAAAEIGQRSEADFALCCWAVEQGLGRTEVWQQASTVGKFAEAGDRYFEATWTAAESHTREKIFDEARKKSKKKAEEKESSASGKTEAEQLPLSNALREGDGDEERTTPLQMRTVIASILERTGNWPRRIESSLFIHEPGQGVSWLETQASLFGWLGTKCGVIDWHRGVGYVGKDETFQELRRTADQYNAIEHLPHEPRMPGHYYACDYPAAGNGEHLSRLVDRFAPETDVDRHLIMAMFATLFWGGKGGTRPAFVIISDSGRGSGKSKLTDMAAFLAGGMIELSQNEDAAVMRQRLLSPDGMTKRIARLDNVKSLRLSWADLESLITTPIISGKRLYVGEGSRPNNLTWLITLNGISLSTDMAQRSVIIKVVRPPREGGWEEETMRFIDQHRPQIIGDLLGLLRIEDPTPLAKYTRWAAWEAGVLARLPNATAIQAKIAERCQSADVEKIEIELIEEFFRERLEEYHYNPELDKVHIPVKLAAEWYNLATQERRSTPQAGQILTQFCSEGEAKYLTVNPSRTYGRGFLWNGQHKENTTNYDLRDRISVAEAARKEKREERSRYF
jgi:hypothetical protein